MLSSGSFGRRDRYTLVAGFGRSSRGVEGPEGPELSSSDVSSRDTGSVVSESEMGSTSEFGTFAYAKSFFKETKSVTINIFRKTLFYS